MTNLKQMAALTALNDMMSKGRFDICAIRSIAEMMNIQLAGEAYNTLKPLHCIDFGKMPQELRDAIPELIRDCLGVAPAYVFTQVPDPGVVAPVMRPESEPTPRGFLSLIGIK